MDCHVCLAADSQGAIKAGCGHLTHLCHECHDDESGRVRHDPCLTCRGVKLPDPPTFDYYDDLFFDDLDDEPVPVSDYDDDAYQAQDSYYDPYYEEM